MKPEIKALKFTVPHEDIYYISWIIDAAEGIGSRDRSNTC